VILSTCNRTEFYTASDQVDFHELEILLSDITGVPIADFQPSLYKLANEEVVDHLYRVAGGLDSQVVGEPQILGQVTQSLELALGCGSYGPMLSSLFRAVIVAGKRVRTETAISRNSASVSSLAATLAAQRVTDISSSQVLVIGAGEMAELAVEALRKRGVSLITVISRTLDKAQDLARRWKADASTFEHLEEWLERADIVISSTSAPHTIVTACMMESVMIKRSLRPLVMVDIAVPRDIDPDVSQIEGVWLYDLDSLNQQVTQFLAVRSTEVPRVEEILVEEKAKFLEYLKTLDMLPIITDLRKQAEQIRTYELNKTFQRMPDLTETERKRIDALTRALVKKILASPTQHLRKIASCPHAPEIATVARELFDLQEAAGLCAISNESCSLHTMACPDRIS